MSKATAGLDLTKYMDKTLELTTGHRKIRGTLKGFDQFKNIVLESSQVQVNALPLLSPLSLFLLSFSLSHLCFVVGFGS